MKDMASSAETSWRIFFFLVKLRTSLCNQLVKGVARLFPKRSDPASLYILAECESTEDASHFHKLELDFDTSFTGFQVNLLIFF